MIKIGILGSGDVGQVLGRGFAARGHQVLIWIIRGFRTNTWNHAFKLLRK